MSKPECNSRTAGLQDAGATTGKIPVGKIAEGFLETVENAFMSQLLIE